MRKFIVWTVGILVILLLAAVIIPFLIPSSVYKAAIEDQLTSRFGRQVTIAGDVKVSPLPVLKVHTEQVEIENPTGFTADHFAQMESLSVRVKLLPLLSRRVEIAAFELVKPIISLEKQSSGEVNWLLGSTDPDIDTDHGPFKRDGRFADLDASIGKFSITNGVVNYDDRQKDRTHTLEEVNLSMSLPSLSSPVSASGDMIINGIAVDAEITLTTPRSYLNGQKTPVDFKFTTILGSATAKGHFTQSEDNHFEFDVKGSLKELFRWSSFFGQSDISDIVDTVNYAGLYSYDGNGITAKGANIALSGPDLSSTFIGDAALTDNPTANGNLTFKTKNINALANYLGTDLPSGNLINEIDLTTQIKTAGTDVMANALNLSIGGDGINAQLTGKARLGESVTFSGDYTANIDSASDLAGQIKMDTSAFSLLGKIQASGTVDYNGNETHLTITDAQTNSSDLTTVISGEAKIGETNQFSGNFTTDILSMSNVANALEMDVSKLAVLGRARAQGTIEYDGTKTMLNVTEATTQSADLETSYAGIINMGDAGLGLNGQFKSTIPNLSSFAAVTQNDIPYTQSIGTIQAQGKVNGSVQNLAIKNLGIELTQGQLNGKFDGNANYVGGLTLQGSLDAEIPSARRLTKTTTGIDLPSSTATGEIYERIAMSGNITGTPSEIQFTNANISMDAIDGGGKFTLDMTKPRPLLKGTLDLGQIDMRPYLDAYMASPPGMEGQLQPWSEVPFDFSALRLMDGNYIIKTPEVIFGPLTFGQTDLDANVTKGVLTARLPQVNLYGGLGVMSASLDATGDIPKITLAVTLEDIRSNRFLSSLADFTRLEGNGHTLLELTGEGRTQGEIMRSLNGYGNFEVLGGLIQGIDLSKFLSGIDETLTQRVLPNGIGNSYATKFDDMVGKFKIQDGVVSIEGFNLKAFNVLASGTGNLDIGQQSLDFSLRPRLTSADASDLGRFGIPLRFQGKWGSISTGPDYQLLQDIAVEKAKLRAREEITERVGGELGGIIGGVLGGGKDETTPNQPETNEPTPEAPEETSIEPPTEPTKAVPAETLETSPTEPEGSTENTKTGNHSPEKIPVPENAEAPPKKESIENQLINETIDGIFGRKDDDEN